MDPRDVGPTRAGVKLLTINDLSVTLPRGGDREYAVSGVSLEIKTGETLCLVGESGSGKTVVADSIMGMLPPQLAVRSGIIELEGRQLPPQRSAAFNTIRGHRMAMIFQDAAGSLDPVQRVGKQLEEILSVHGVPSSEWHERILDMLAAVRLPHPQKMVKTYPHQLSGGQAQRIVIAGALLLDPALLIADEPTTAVDVTTQAEILKLIATLQRERNASVLFITHDFGVVSQIADRICVMNEGKIVESGRARQVLEAPTHHYTRKLLAAATRRASGKAVGDSPAVLSVERVKLTYRLGNFLERRHVRAIRDVSFELHQGKTLAVVGESGSGKSSVARCLLRLENPDAGSIRYRGQDIATMKGNELRNLRSRIQIVLQDPYGALNPRQKIRSAIAEGPVIHGLRRKDAIKRAEHLLELTGLTAQAADRYPHEFSGGQRQRICIARALAVQPEILVADEAVSALDVSIQAQILDLFRNLQKDLGFALLFITHDLSVAAAISNDILVIKDGYLVEGGPVDKVFGNPKTDYTKELLEAAPRFSGSLAVQT